MPRRVEADVTVSQQLYRSMVYFQMFRRRRGSRRLMLAAYLISIGVVVARLTGYYDVAAYSFGVFTFYACVVYLFFPLLLCLFTEYQVRRIARSGRTVIGQKHRMVIDETGVGSHTAAGSATFGWDQLVEGYELRDAFLFYVTGDQALALARADVTPDQAGLIRELAQEKLGEKFRIDARPAK